MNFSIREVSNGYTLKRNNPIADETYVFESLPALQIWLNKQLEETYGTDREAEQPELPFDGGLGAGFKERNFHI